MPANDEDDILDPDVSKIARVTFGYESYDTIQWLRDRGFWLA